MSDKLFGRVKRLVSGAVNGGVDALEASMPDATMGEAICEIERTIRDVRDELSAIAKERHIAGRRVQLSKDKIEALQGKVAAALKAGREDLAEAAVERELDLEAQIPVLEETQVDATKRIARLNSYVAALQGRKAEMQVELDAFKVAQNQDVDFSSVIDGVGQFDRLEERAESAENAFNRVMTNSTGVAAIGKSDRDTIAKLVELESIERSNKISNRLDSYRKELSETSA